MWCSRVCVSSRGCSIIDYMYWYARCCNNGNTRADVPQLPTNKQASGWVEWFEYILCTYVMCTCVCVCEDSQVLPDRSAPQPR